MESDSSNTYFPFGAWPGQSLITATAGFSVTADNKSFLVVSILSPRTLGFAWRPAIAQRNDFRLPEGAKDALCCSTTTSFHFVPTLERTTRERALPSKISPFVRQRGILCGYFIVFLHSTVKRSSSALRQVDFAIPYFRMESKTLTSRFRDQAFFVRAVVIVVLTAQLLVSVDRLHSMLN